MPIHEAELETLITEYTARKHAAEIADGGHIYQADGDTFNEFEYEPFWHYEHAIHRYREFIDRADADLIEDGGRRVDDPDNTIPEYLDKRRDGRLDPY